MNVYLEGDPQWPAFVGALLAGLMGATIGAFSIFLLELWRQVLAFRAAARVVINELIENITNVKLGIEHQVPNQPYSEEAWKAHRLDLSHLLSQEDFNELGAVYGRTYLVKAALAIVSADADKAKVNLDPWVVDAENAATGLAVLRSQSRLTQLWTALRGKSLTRAIGITKRATAQKGTTT